eukprot:CAMPEP_0185385546 /NCGR_PEP_ID=MMETSP1364-20130426/62257_1 /TAXON_ID=38817 /ORGANISM="Gephyrocapsa oceanica, Strain RCC1303" /LENGTH=43 /DNA_ID= /DNA_START= /DNA_END= /DNA_ORIENTATION=
MLDHVSWRERQGTSDNAAVSPASLVSSGGEAQQARSGGRRAAV